MKIQLLFILCLLPIFSYSQELPFGMDWYLNEFNVSGQDIPIPNLDEVNYVQANFYSGNPDTFVTGACNLCEGEVIVDLNFSTIEFNLSCTLSDCINSDNDFFDNAYTIFFQNSNTYDYEIGWIDGPPGPDETILWITSPNGDYAIYTDLQPLSIPDFSDYEIILFPNPVSGSFTITSKSNLDTLSVSVYNVSGKLMLSENNITSNEAINIQQFKTGIYFVSITDEKGNTSIKKMLKK